MTKHLAKLMLIPVLIFASLIKIYVGTTYDYGKGYELSYCGLRFACSLRGEYVSCAPPPPDMTGYY